MRDFKPKESATEIQRFLTVIDFYLRGVSASAEHADLITKLAGDALRSVGPADFSLAEMQNLVVNRSSIEALPGVPLLLVSDPLRLSLRQVLVGFDAPRPENEEQDRELLAEGAQMLWGLTDERRRELCLYAIKDAMGQFQALYRVVSSAYSELRSTLMTAN